MQLSFNKFAAGLGILALGASLSMPALADDKDRGHSEGKGHNDGIHGVALPPATNPHGMPVGKPATHGDTDRGRSEGEGHNDRAHHNNRALRGRIVSVNPTALTVRLRDGSLQTYAITPAQFATLRHESGENINFRLNGSTLVLVHS